MKTTRTILLGMLVSSILFSSCIGSFRLTGNVYSWNNSFREDLLREVVFLGLVIAPIYAFTLFVDALLFNTIEFWSGKNPISMKEGEKDIKVVENNNKIYQITASKNRFDITQLQGPNKGVSESLIYDPEASAWFLETECNIYQLCPGILDLTLDHS